MLNITEYLFLLDLQMLPLESLVQSEGLFKTKTFMSEVVVNPVLFNQMLWGFIKILGNFITLKNIMEEYRYRIKHKKGAI